MKAAALEPGLASFQASVADFVDGSDTPSDYLERALSRLADWEPRLQAFTALSLETARAAADLSTQRWRSGRQLSSIDGMPVGIKDVIDTVDLPTELGMRAYAGYRPPVDAATVYALREAGAVLVGKTATTEFAMTHPAPTRNPHDLDRTPGGSSSGSAAAVGAGILPAALGTQAIGSIIRPASFCGAFGYKPTFGSLNRGGSHDTQSQSCIGAIGASLPDLWHTAWEIAARVGGDPGQPGLAGPAELGRPTRPATVVHLETDGWGAVPDQARGSMASVLDLLRDEGVTILHAGTQPAVARLEKAIEGSVSKGRQIINYESRWPLDPIRRADPTSLSQTLAARMTAAESVDRDGYLALLDWRQQARDAYAEVMGQADAVVTLSAAGAAPAGLTATGDAALAVPATILGVPALTLPVLQDEGMPLGLQVLGGAHQDAELFRTADWILSLLG